MKSILDDIRSELKINSNEKTREEGKRYFKEEIRIYGVKIPIVGNIAKRYFPLIEKTSKSEIFQLCEELWKSGYMEESFVACEWSYSVRNRFEKEDMMMFEHWLQDYVSNWASCDTLCNHTIAALIEMYPELINTLKTWTKSKNRWVKRGAAVTLIIPARNGLFLKDIFEISDALLEDTDDLVRKGYGWMLKAASQAHQREVFDYVMKRKNKMPRTALRYAIEKMPLDLKKQAMK